MWSHVTCVYKETTVATRERTQFIAGSVCEHISLIVWLQQLRYDTPLVYADVNLLVLNRSSMCTLT